MGSYRAAWQHGQRLHEATGKRIRIYQVRTATCTCAGNGHDFRGFEWFARTLPAVPLQLPNLHQDH